MNRFFSLASLILVFIITSCATSRSTSAPTWDTQLLQQEGVDPDFRAAEGFPILYGEGSGHRAAMNKFLHAYKHRWDLPEGYGWIPREQLSVGDIQVIDNSHTTMWEAFHTGYTSWLDGFGHKWGLVCGSKSDFSESEQDSWHWKISSQCDEKVGGQACRGWFFQSFDRQYNCVVCREH